MPVGGKHRRYRSVVPAIARQHLLQFSTFDVWRGYCCRKHRDAKATECSSQLGMRSLDVDAA